MTHQKTSDKRISLRASDVMVKDVIMIDENASVKMAADVMKQSEIGSIIATRNGKGIGILTERDLLKRIVTEGKNPKKTKVKNIMSSPLTTITPDAYLEEAAHLMSEKKIKRLPVIDHNRIMGLLSLTEIARCQPHIMRVLNALSAMHKTQKNAAKF